MGEQEAMAQESIAPLEAAQAWRQQLIRSILRALTLFGLLALAAGSYSDYSRGSGWTIPIYLGAYAVLASITFWQRAPYILQVGILLLIFYGLGIVSTANFGLGGDGGIFLFISVLAMLFLGWQWGVLALVLCVLTMAAFGWMFSTALLTIPVEKLVIGNTQLTSWLSTGVVFLMLGVLVVFSQNYVFRRLLAALTKSHELTQELAADITERKRMEAALQESEERHRTISELVSEYAFSIQPQSGDRMVREWTTGSFTRITGFTTEERDARGGILRNVHPEDMPIAQQYFQSLFSGDREDTAIEFRIATKSGEERWVRAYARPKRDEAQGRVTSIIGAVQDITERKRAEHALQESEERFKNAFEYAPIGMVLVDLEGRALQVNRALCQIVGYSEQELVGTRFQDITHPDDLDTNLNYGERLIRGEVDSYQIEKRYFHKLGHIVWVSLSASLVRDAHSRPLYVVSQVQDITERKRAEEKLHEADSRYRMLVERIPAITYIAALDETSTTFYVSPQVETILGFSPADYRANPDIWREQLHPDDRERVLVEVARSHATGEPLASDYRMLARDGRVVWFHDEATLVCGTDGLPLFLQGVMLDLTSRKQAEEALRASETKFRSLVEQSSDGIILFDEQGLVVEWNRGQEQITDLKHDDVLGRPVWDVLRQMASDESQDLTAHERNEAAFTEFLSTGQAPYLYSLTQYDIRRPDGRHRTVQTTVFPVQTKSGYMGGATTHDITIQRQIEELLMSHAQEMEALYKTSLEINAQSDVPTLLQAIVRRAASLVGTEMGGLYLMKPDSLALELVVNYNLPGDYLGVTLRLGEGLSGRVAQTGKPIAIDDYLHWEGRPAVYANATVRRVLGVPLKVRDKVIGVLNVNDGKRTGPFGEDEIRLVSLFADQAAIAIENVRLYQAEREQRELAETMREISAALASTLDRDIVLDRLLANISRIVPNEAADIMLVERDRARFVRWYGYERFGIQDLTNVAFLIADRPHLQQMIETCGPVFVSDTHTDPSWGHPPIMEWLRSYAGAPICVRGETIGFLDVTSAEPGAFGRQHAERLRAFADQAAIALENARLFEQARDSADRLQAMSQRLVEAQETERRHIAQELHDEIGQIVTGLKLRLEMSSQLPDSALRDTLSEAERLVQELLERVRALSLDLRPAMLDDLGLVPALLWLVERFAAQAKVEVAFKHNGVEHRRFSPEVETAAYRIVQEALTNVARHANASAVTVRLWATQDTLGMQVADDGVGFNPEMALTRGTSTGLSSMRERAVLLGGNLEIESSSGMGTRLTAELPLDNAT